MKSLEEIIAQRKTKLEWAKNALKTAKSVNEVFTYDILMDESFKAKKFVKKTSSDLQYYKDISGNSRYDYVLIRVPELESWLKLLSRHFNSTEKEKGEIDEEVLFGFFYKIGLAFQGDLYPYSMQYVQSDWGHSGIMRSFEDSKACLAAEFKLYRLYNYLNGSGILYLEYLSDGDLRAYMGFGHLYFFKEKRGIFYQPAQIEKIEEKIMVEGDSYPLRFRSLVANESSYITYDLVQYYIPIHKFLKVGRAIDKVGIFSLLNAKAAA
jgi:hypothetical protein